MKLESNLLIAVLTFVGCFVLLAMRPVPAAAVQNVKSISGKIIKVSEDGGPGDIMIRLKNDRRTYYLNRGMDQKLTLEMFKNNLLYRQATLDFVNHWTPLDPISSKISVARVSVSGQTYWQQPAAKFVMTK